MEQGSDGGDAPTAFALRALGLGDLLVAVPALRALRRLLPDHRIVLGAPAWLADVVALLPGVDAHVAVPGLDGPVPALDGPVDVAVNLHGDGRQSAALLGALGARRTVAFASPGRPGLAWDPVLPERVRWLRLLEAQGASGDPDDLAVPRPTTPSPTPDAIVLHVGAAFGSRRWPRDRFAAVAAALAAAGERVVLSGSTAERPDALAVAEAAGLPASAVLAGSMPLAGFAGLIAEARLLISGDTGAAHLATAFGTPSVVLFGPAPAELWGPPPGGPHVVLTDAAQRAGDVFGATPDPALLAVTPEAVLSAAHALLR